MVTCVTFLVSSIHCVFFVCFLLLTPNVIQKTQISYVPQVLDRMHGSQYG